MNNKRTVILILVAGIILSSCSTTKMVPAGDALYTGASVDVQGPDLTARKKRELRKDLESITRPRPNKKILGIPLNLMFYNSRLFRRRLGEPPVLLSQVNLDFNIKLLENNLENRGYFQAKVQGDTVVKRKKARANYVAQTGPLYKISQVFLPEDSSILSSYIREASPHTFLKPGDPFDLAVVKGERLRIDAYLKERGYYYFSEDYLLVRVDTTIGANTVNMYVTVKPETPDVAKNIYYIDDVFIYPNYDIRVYERDTLKTNAQYFEGYYVVQRREQFKPRLFSESMQFNPGDVYNRRDHSQTISRLVNLNLFKFVKNRFESVPSADTAKLDAYYYLTPFPKKSLRAEINANTKSNNQTGSAFTVGWRNRNTFRGGELLALDFTTGFEVQISGQQRGYNTFRIGGDINFNTPRFLSPFHITNKGGFVPRTDFLLGYELLTKQKLYTMQSFRFGFGYNWKENFQKEHDLKIININYVQPLLITDLYRDSAVRNRTLLKAVEEQFILGTYYNHNYNQMLGRPQFSSGMYFNGNVDLSGNIAGLVTGANVKDGKQKKIFNAPFSQYVRLESDLRYYAKVSPTMVWANRLITGLGIPYGNSLQLPYIKQFFVGGTNSLRAFRSRSVGPGSYRDTISTNFLPDQSGDIKLEINTELRAKLAGIVHGAVFIDAGNIWLFNEDTLKPGAKFTGDFIKQLAIGGGVGLRFDINFLVIRFDVAFPFRMWYPEGKEWVLNEIRFHNSDWRKRNIVFNLGIGYPF